MSAKVPTVAAASRLSSSEGQRQDASATVDRADALAKPSGKKFDMILANPPFGKKGASEEPWTKDLWIYDLRTNRHFALKTKPLKQSDLEDFVKCYRAPTRARSKETERFRKFRYDEITARDKANLDLFWLKDETLEDSENLPPPAELAAEIVESLDAALGEFRAVELNLIKGGDS